MDTVTYSTIMRSTFSSALPALPINHLNFCSLNLLPGSTNDILRHRDLLQGLKSRISSRYMDHEYVYLDKQRSTAIAGVLGPQNASIEMG